MVIDKKSHFTLISISPANHNLTMMQGREEKSILTGEAVSCNPMAKVCWPYFDPEYENLSMRINPPRFSFRLSVSSKKICCCYIVK